MKKKKMKTIVFIITMICSIFLLSGISKAITLPKNWAIPASGLTTAGYNNPYLWCIDYAADGRQRRGKLGHII